MRASLSWASLICALTYKDHWQPTLALADHNHPPGPAAAVLRSNPLKGLPPLPKIHYSWPFPFQAGACANDGPHPGSGCVRYLNDSSPTYLDGFLHDYVRITGSCPLDLATATKLEVTTCAELCASSANVPARCLALNYSPWYAMFPSNDPTVTGAPEQAEMRLYTDLLSNVSLWLRASPHGHTVGVGAFLLDQEKFSASATSSLATIVALTRKCDLIFNASIAAFPDARVEWYNRGAVSEGYTYGWVGPIGAKGVNMQWSHFTGRERGHSFSASIYNIRFLPSMRETYRRTVQYALQFNATGLNAVGGSASPGQLTGGVTPWLAIGCGYHLLPTHNCSQDQMHYDEPCETFDFNSPYDPVLSWQLGSELHNLTQYSSAWHPGFSTADAFAPWNFSQVVCLYPSVLDPRGAATQGGASTSLVDHLVSYIRGATGLEGVTGKQL